MTPSSSSATQRRSVSYSAPNSINTSRHNGSTSTPRRKKVTPALWTNGTIRALVLVLALFCLIDVYYLANIAEHGKLQNVKPGRIIREQLDKVLQKKDTAESPVKPANEAEYERYDPVKVAKWKMQLIEEARIDQKEKEEISQGAETYESISDEDLDYDKDQIYEILEQAGIHKSELNKATRAQLPTWTKVLREYGDHPLI